MGKTKYSLTRRDILSRAFEECMEELYFKAQPSADYRALIEGKMNGTVVDTNDDPIYKRYYLSDKEMKYIVDKYIESYRIKEEWTSNCDLILRDLKEGGLVDSYVTDDNGTSHREAKHTKPLSEEIGEDNAEKVFELIKGFRNFYRFDREKGDWSCWVYLGGSPSSNKESVIQYWKEHEGIDITIEDRDEETFWYRDEYGDEWEQVYNEEMEDYERYKEEKSINE